MNRMADGAAMLERRRAEQAGVTVIYCRVRVARVGDATLHLPTGVAISAPDGNNNVVVSLAITATRGRSPYQQESESGVTVSAEMQDYLVLITDFASYWAVASGETNPMQGDYILDNPNGVSGTFRLMPPGNEPIYGNSGSYGNTWRLHTKNAGA